MREVSPKLAEELSTLLVLKLVLNHLKKVCPELADELAVLQISQKKSGGEKMPKKKLEFLVKGSHLRKMT